MRFYDANQRADVCKTFSLWLDETGVRDSWNHKKECPGTEAWLESRKQPGQSSLSSAQSVLITLLLDVWTSGDMTSVADLGHLDDDKREAVGDLIAACCSRNVRAKVEKWLDDHSAGGNTATAEQGNNKET